MRINVGCGSTPTIGDGWRNFDNSPSLKLARRPIRRSFLRMVGLLDENNWKYIEFCRANRIEFADCRHLPLVTGSVDVAYSSHMMEHLARPAAAEYLRESLRVLRPGGVLRISVPDLMYYAKRYAGDGNLEHFMYHVHLAVPAMPRLREKMKYFWVGPRHHQWMYDGPHLSSLMVSCGFVDPVVQPAGKTTIPDPGPLDLSERAPESLYVEARKPTTP
jgi:SAM-dependent methyltransferase